jgi:hypothetical protein
MQREQSNIRVPLSVFLDCSLETDHDKSTKVLNKSLPQKPNQNATQHSKTRKHVLDQFYNTDNTGLSYYPQ